MNTKEIGNAGEAAVLAKFAKLGIQVYLPFGEGSRTDMIVDFNGKLQKIQVKSVYTFGKDSKKYCAKLTSNYARRVHQEQDILYTSEQVDYFGIYCFERPEPILVPYKEVIGQKSITIRCSMPESGQLQKIWFEPDFLFEEQIEPKYINNTFYRKYKQEEFEKRKEQKEQNKILLAQLPEKIKNRTPLTEQEREIKINRCVDCGEIIGNNATRCPKCSHLHSRKIVRPSREELKELVRAYSFKELGKRFNVSDKAISKWCIVEGLPYKKRDIKKYSDEEWSTL